MNADTLLQVEDLRVYFYLRAGVVKAVDGVSFCLGRGETLGIVGESGSGKSMTALAILGLVPQPAGQIVGGRVIYEGEDLLLKSRQEMSKIRGGGICMIPQDPSTSLNPVFTVGDQLTETLRIDGRSPKNALWSRGTELLHMMRIPSPEMSGGMRQRAVGAISLSRRPKLIIADEPTTALDTTTQAQYLRTLSAIQAEMDLSIIFITHDFGIVARICDRVAVMYAGKIVESAGVDELFANPAHPYTEALLRSVPDLEDDLQLLHTIEGQPPSPENMPPGCSFAPLCPFAFERCRIEYPPEFGVKPGHVARCWRLASDG